MEKVLEIAELRALTGLSQSKFSKKYHITLSTLQAWEQKKNRTPDYVLYLLTEVLKYEGYFYDKGNNK